MNKKSLIFPAVIVLSIYTLYGCVLTPLYHTLIRDVVLQRTLWLDLVDLLFQYAEILGTACLCGFLCYGIYRHGLRGSRMMLIFGGCAMAYKYLATVIAVSVINGSIDLTGELTAYLFSLLLELAIVACTVFLAHRFLSPVLADVRLKREAAAKLDKEPPKDDGCYPFQSLLRWKNPLQRATFLGMLLIVIWRLVGFISSEFAYGVALKASDVPVLLLYAVILILVPGFLGYLLSLLCIRLSVKKNI